MGVSMLQYLDPVLQGHNPVKISFQPGSVSLVKAFPAL